MAKDDYEVVAYKVLAYLYACIKAGAVPSLEKAHEISRVNETYFYAVLSSLLSRGFIEEVKEFRDINGDVIAVSGSPVITLDGASYLKQNTAMNQVKTFLGSAFEAALTVAVQATLSL